MKFFTILTICIFSIIPRSYAEDTDWGDLKLPQGTKVILGKSPDGDEIRELQFPGGVIISQRKDAQGNVSSMGADSTKGGAVLCIGGLLMYARIALSACPIQHETEASINNLDIALNRIDNFIASNSLTPVTKQEVSRQRQIEMKEATENLSLEQCANAYTQRIMRWPQTLSLKTYIDKLLEIPRPPVLNPCL